MKNKISPSMMCADFTEIKSQIRIFEKEQIDYLHIDIMDGHFVPNFTLGTDYCKKLHEVTSIPLDIHLMVEEPENKLPFFSFKEGDYVSVHAESTHHLQRVLSLIRSMGAKPMVALNPATPISVLEYVLDDIDGVLVMTVNPGFAGQKLIDSALQKVRQLRNYLDKKGYEQIEIEVDGNVSFENISAMKESGANIFVAGTSSIFHKDFSVTDAIDKMKALLGGEACQTPWAPLPELEKYQNFHCVCGKKHDFSTQLCIEDGALSKLPQIVRSFDAQSVYLVADKNTYAVTGETVKNFLTQAGIAVSSYIFQEDKVVPDEASVGRALMHVDRKCNAIVGVGSGVINDICKIIADAKEKPYIIVATAPSMDGYASATSSMEREGLKISLPSKAPEAVVGDLDILGQAPLDMMTAGLGDMLAKYISLTEWKIAHIITGEYYCEEVSSLMQTALHKCVAHADGLLHRDKEAVRAVFEGLVISGAATEYAGVSRPASGVEHYISHVWDMRGVSFGTPVSSHGWQCAIGTLYVLRLYEQVKEMTPNKEKALSYVQAFNYEAYKENLRNFLGQGAESMIALEETEQKYSQEKHALRLERILVNWQEIKAIMDTLPKAGDLEALLLKNQMPTTLEEIGLEKDLLKSTFEYTKDIRDKYVLSRLVWDLGMMDDLIF